MTEEPTMPIAEEAAQRVYAKKLTADRESKKRKRAEESQEQQENRLAADRAPPGQHVRRYNAPTIDEVAIAMVSDHFLPRDIILHQRNAQLVRIAETHRRYDALEYPIIFWDGADGYHFNIKLINPATNKEMNKT
ncbi:uncharacterized protein LOC136038397 [Artemia franciscana]|uniref:uncharacterized protein LOC136038397 n=1 Tax=Artemia franciscana TaxID=6661 RepID=UPI0032DAB4CE